MPDVLAIVSKAVFERDARGGDRALGPGDVWPTDRYTSANKTVESVADGGRIFLVTVRPPGEALWLVGVLDAPRLAAGAWVAAPNAVPITDITALVPRIAFESGKGISTNAPLAMSLQAPRALAAADEALLLAATQAVPAAAARSPDDPDDPDDPGDPDDPDDEEAAPAPARDRRPHDHVIEPSRSSRSSCRSCGKPIGKGELRLAEAFVSSDGSWARGHRYARSERRRDPALVSDDDRRTSDYGSADVAQRFHHLACAATHEPTKLQSALDSYPLDDALRGELERAIAAAAIVVDAAEANTATRDRYRQLLAVAANDEDGGGVVLGDWLQQVGDPRGELVSVQLALETATDDERLRLQAIERKLIAYNGFVPKGLEAQPAWRRGFIHRLVASRGQAFVDAYHHPSLRLLRELALALDEAWPTALTPALPATLRVLELGGQVGRVVLPAGVLAKLTRLVITGIAERGTRAHPGVVELELASPDATALESAVRARYDAPAPLGRSLVDRIADLEPRALPALRAITLRVDRGLDAAAAALVASKLFPQLARLALHGDLSPAGVAKLVASGGRLDMIDVVDCAALAATGAEPLHAIAREVRGRQRAAKPVGEWLVRHTRKPEWGVGRVVAETDDGLDVEFEHGGSKHVRNVELLEEVAV